MDCTSDINDVPVFVRPTPTTRVLPDDYRLQTSTGSAPGNLRHRSSSANRLRLVPVCGSTQRCCSHGTVRTLCCRQRNSSTRSLLSIAEFDSQHSNVDAHSCEIQSTDLRYYAQGDDHVTAAGSGGSEVHLISLKPDEILSQIRSSPPCCNPVRFQSYEASSAIGEVTLTGLHNGKSNAHISIVEIKFKSGQKIDLSGVKTLTVEILGLDRRSKKHKITGSMISQTSNKICTTLKDILLHVQIFYWKDQFINIRVELLDHDIVDQLSSRSSDAYSTVISHATVIHPRPLIMSTLPDDDRILHNQPPSDTMVCVSGTEAAKFYLVHSHNSRDDENCRAMQPATNMGTNEEMVEVSNTSQNNFSINLDCKKLYSIINSRETIQYPCIFRTTWSFSNNTTVPIILRVLPLKCGGRHISLWAEISSPVPQCLPLDQITVEATAYNPCKGRNCGQLGRSVRCTENLKFIKTEQCSRCQVSFDELMLQMHAFYCKQIQIDIKSY